MRTRIREDGLSKYVRCARQIVRPVPTREVFLGNEELCDGGSSFEVGQTVRVLPLSGQPVFRVNSCRPVRSAVSADARVELWSGHGIYHQAGMHGSRGTVHGSQRCWQPRLLRKVDVPSGKQGNFTIERFNVDEDAAALYNLRRRRRMMRPGTYTRLYTDDLRCFGGSLWMSDTPAELRDHICVTRSDVNGNVCINGLGLGVALQAVLDNPQVARVVVVEINEDVIKLVAPHYQRRYGQRLIVVHGDAFKWKPDFRFNFVWHDIWDAICGDHYESMKRLHRRWSHWTDAQDSWCRDEMRRSRGLGAKLSF